MIRNCKSTQRKFLSLGRYFASNLRKRHCQHFESSYILRITGKMMIKEYIVQDIGTMIYIHTHTRCLAASGLNFSMQNLHWVMQGLFLWHMDSLVVACKLSDCREGLVTPRHVES